MGRGVGGGGFRGCGWSGEGSGNWERGEFNEVMMVKGNWSETDL